MFDFIYEWLWNFVCYMVLMTAFIQILPENSYQKYLRFFFGLILILLLATPVLRILGMENRFSELYDKSEYKRMQKEMEDSELYLEEWEQHFWKEDVE